MGVMYYILSPFSWLLNFFYSFTDSYGISLILFALVIKIILFPLTIKGKKGMIQMNLLSGKMQQLQKQYGKDRERYNLEIQKLYEKEKVNPMSGCLWSFIPVLIIVMFYTGMCLWVPTMNLPFFAAGTNLVGGLMSMRIIHYFMMFVFIAFTLLHAYLANIEGLAPSMLMFFGKEHGGLTYDIEKHNISGKDDLAH